MRRKTGNLDDLRECHAGETIVVMGNSASLCEMPLELLLHFTTIGVNRILSIYQPTYLYQGNTSPLREHGAMMEEATPETTMLIYGPKMGSLGQSLYHGPWMDTGRICPADPAAKTGAIDIGRIGNSGYQAAQMAYRMGAAVIALAGIDLTWPKGKPSHHFGDGRRIGCRLSKPEETAKDFEELKHIYKEQGVDVVSISPWRTSLRTLMGYVPLSDLDQYSQEVDHGDRYDISRAAPEPQGAGALRRAARARRGQPRRKPRDRRKGRAARR